MKFLALLIAALSLPLHAATLFVSKNGSDQNPGSASAPFLTVQKAANTLRAGDTLQIFPGTYAEDVRLYNAGTSNAPITIDGLTGASVNSLMLFEAWTTIQNLEVKGKTNQAMIYMNRKASHCVISNNVVDGQYYGVNLISWGGPDAKPFGNAGSDNLIVSNIFMHATGSLAFAIFGDRNEFRGNQMIDCDSVDWLRLFGRDNRFVGNLCSNNVESGVSGNHPDFLQVFGTQGFGSRGHLIESNTIVGMGGAGQLCMLSADDIEDIQDFTIRNNVFVGIAAKGTICIRNVKFHNNLFYRCSTNSYTAGPVLIFTSFTNRTYPNFSINAAHGGQVLNNVFLDCGTGLTNSRPPYAFITNLTDVIADYNFVAVNGKEAIIVDPLRQMVGDPGGWNPYRWWEEHGINGGDPMFYDVPNLDFRFPENSFLTGAGLPLNHLFQTDMIGTLRGQNWDIGPSEIPACSTSKKL